jgi:glutamyl-Q tRNA(Asp) synthetase
VPAYAHVPLLCAADGRKLSKQNGAAAIDNDQPLANLRRVLSLLRQDAASAPAVDAEQLLRRAVDGWNPAALPQPPAQLVYAGPSN